MLIVAVGDHSEWGKLLGLVGEAGSEDTPLQEKLADLAAAIGKIGLGVAVASFIALLIKWVAHAAPDRPPAALGSLPMRLGVPAAGSSFVVPRWPAQHPLVGIPPHLPSTPS